MPRGGVTIIYAYLNCFPRQVKAIKNKMSLPNTEAVGDMYAHGGKIKEEGSV